MNICTSKTHKSYNFRIFFTLGSFLQITRTRKHLEHEAFILYPLNVVLVLQWHCVCKSPWNIKRWFSCASLVKEKVRQRGRKVFYTSFLQSRQAHKQNTISWLFPIGKSIGRCRLPAAELCLSSWYLHKCLPWDGEGVDMRISVPCTFIPDEFIITTFCQWKQCIPNE